MIQIRCQKCGRVLQAPPNWERRATCNNCGGYFQELNSSYNLSNQFQQIGNQFQSNIPSIMIGKEGIYTQKQGYPNPNPPSQQNMPYNPPQNVNFPHPEDDLYEKIRKYALWIVVSVVIGYAVWRIIDFIFLS